jgi:hypothetical protein
MARPQIADGGDGLQIWRIVANILNRQSWTVDKGRSSSLGVGRGATTPRCKNSFVMKGHKAPRPLDGQCT